MSLFSKLFGGGSAKAPALEAYNGYSIFPEPVKEDGGFRIAARIEKGEGDAMQTHLMIRADTYAGEDTARDASVDKAKQVIDQLGDKIFR